jgi:hypothetical protein
MGPNAEVFWYAFELKRCAFFVSREERKDFEDVSLEFARSATEQPTIDFIRLRRHAELPS